MKIYEICKYGKVSYSAEIEDGMEYRLNDMSNNFHYVKEVELNEETICSLLNKIFELLDNSNLNMHV